MLEDGVARVAIDDGKVNAFSIPMLEALHAALDRAEADGAVLVLEGREGYFSAGFDLRVFQEEPERLPLMLRLGATLCGRLLAFPAPVLAACAGHAIAAGSFVLLSADARIGVEGPFKIGLNEVRIGLTMPLFVVELARARLAPADFDRALISARMHSPEEAVAAGFLDRAVAAAELGDAVATTAADIALGRRARRVRPRLGRRRCRRGPARPRPRLRPRRLPPHLRGLRLGPGAGGERREPPAAGRLAPALFLIRE